MILTKDETKLGLILGTIAPMLGLLTFKLGKIRHLQFQGILSVHLFRARP
jgi:hypothetical protein